MPNIIEELITETKGYGDEKRLVIYNYRSQTGTGYLNLDRAEATLLFLELYKFLELDKNNTKEKVLQ